MQFISHYTEKKRAVRLTCKGKGRTRQSAKDECDINFIMQKYQVTEAQLHANRYSGNYGFVSSETLHDAMNIVTKATSMFEELPSTVRNKFNGQAGDFLEFTRDPANLPEMAKLGLTADSYEPPEKEPDKTVQTVTAEAEAEAQRLAAEKLASKGE